VTVYDRIEDLVTKGHVAINNHLNLAAPEVPGSGCGRI
jgi:hypothetical protein